LVLYLLELDIQNRQLVKGLAEAYRKTDSVHWGSSR
jgi:lipoprotein NlpI